MLNNYVRYLELKTKIELLKKELENVQAEIKADLKNGPCIIDGDKIIFSDGTGKLTISETKTLKPAAWDLVNASGNPDQYIKYGTRELLTVH